MARPLSEQLADLSARAKQAEDEVAAAKTEAADKIHQRQDEIKADAARRKASIDQHVADAGDSVHSAWTGITTKVQSDIDDLRTKIDVRAYQHDRNKANKEAERAEDNALRAIDYALDSIDYAETAVLDALVARETADAM